MTGVETASLDWTVLTWNLQGSKRTDLDRVADVVRAAVPDVVVLQEVRRPQVLRLARALSMRHTWAEKHNPFRPFLSGRAEGAAILTPHDLDGADHAVVSDATSMWSYKRRIVLWATVARADHSAYRVFDTHLSPHDMAAERLTEAGRVSAIAARLGDSPPTVVAGDLNDHGEPGVIAALPGDELQPAPATNPSESPDQHLDHVLLPEGSTIVDTTAPHGDERWAELSDHLPVTVRFSFDWVQGDWAGGRATDPSSGT